MDEDFDIYGDLASIHEVEEGEDAKTLKEIKKNLEETVEELKSKLAQLEGQNTQLKTNFSSLIKTAKAEISRKDRTITDLRSKLDNVTFRRNHNRGDQQPVNTPIGTNPLVQFQDVVNSNFSYPPPSMNFSLQNQPVGNVQFCFPPPPITFPINNIEPEINTDFSEEYIKSEKELVDTESKSHNEEEIVKQECPKTLYGERLRQRLLKEEENERKQKEAELKSNEENNAGLFEEKKIEAKQKECMKNDRRQLEEQKNKENKVKEKEMELRQVEERRSEIRRQEDKKREERYQEELKCQMKLHEEMKNTIKRQDEEKKNGLRKQEDKRNEIRRQEELRNNKKNDVRQQEDKRAEDERRSEIRRQEDKKREQRYQEELKNRKRQDEKRNEVRKQEEQKNKLRLEEEKKRQEEQKNKIKLEEEKKYERASKEDKRNDPNCSENKRYHKKESEENKDEQQSKSEKPKGKQEERKKEDSKVEVLYEAEKCNKSSHVGVKIRNNLVEQANNKENRHSFGNKSNQGLNKHDESKPSNCSRIPGKLEENSHAHSLESSNRPERDISSFDKYEGTNGSHISAKDGSSNRNHDDHRHKDYRNQNHHTNNHRSNDYRKNHANELLHGRSRREMHQSERHRHRSPHKSSDRHRSSTSHHLSKDQSDRRRSRSNNRSDWEINDRRRSKSSNRMNKEHRIKQYNCPQENSGVSSYYNKDSRMKHELQSSSVVNTYNRDSRVRQNDSNDVHIKHNHRKTLNIFDNDSEEKLNKNKDRSKSPRCRKRAQSEEVISPRKKPRKEVDSDFIDSMFAVEAYEAPKKRNIPATDQTDNNKAMLTNEKSKIESDKLLDKVNKVSEKRKGITDQINENVKEELLASQVNKDSNHGSISKEKDDEQQSHLEEGEITSDSDDEENLKNRLNSLKNQLEMLENESKNQKINNIPTKLSDHRNKSDKSLSKVTKVNAKMCKSDKNEKGIMECLQNANSSSCKNNSKNNDRNEIKPINHDSNRNDKSSEERDIEKSTSDKSKKVKIHKKFDETTVFKSEIKNENNRSDQSKTTASFKTDDTKNINIQVIEETTLNTVTSQKNNNLNKDLQSKTDDISQPEDKKSHPSIKQVEIKANTKKEEVSKCQSSQDAGKIDCSEIKKKEWLNKTDSDIARQGNKKPCTTKNVLEQKVTIDRVQNSKPESEQNTKKNNNDTGTKQEKIITKNQSNDNVGNNCTETKKKELDSEIDSEITKQDNKKYCLTENIEKNVNIEIMENAKLQTEQDVEKYNNCLETKQEQDIAKYKLNQDTRKSDCTETKNRKLDVKIDREVSKPLNKTSCPIENPENTENADKVESKNLRPDQSAEENINCPQMKQEPSNNCTKKSPVKSSLNYESPAKKSKTDLVDAIKTIVPKSQLGKNIIIVRRRRRPVQLADSPPVLVVKDGSINKSN